MPHGFRRSERVDELLKQEIALVVRDLKDPRVGFATVMDVASSPDLRHARVYVSVMGEEEEKQSTLDALQGARGYIRSRIGKALSLKYLPEIHFELDRSLERAARIEEILDRAHEEEEDE